MNLLILLLSLIALEVSGFDIPPPIREAVIALHKKCVKETGVALEHIHKCEENHIPEDPDVKCYLACLHDNADVDLNKKIAVIQGANLAISDDIHKLVTHVRNECKEEDFNIPDRCEGAWLKTNCHLKSHEDVQEFCAILRSADI